MSDRLRRAPGSSPHLFEKDDWLTPPGVIEPLKRLGGVRLDPCSNPWSLVPAHIRIMLPKHDAPESVRALSALVLAADLLEARHSSVPVVVWGDGLATPWAPLCRGHRSTLVYVNPPYSRPGPWAEKARREYDVGGVESVSLLPAATSEGWWHSQVVGASAIVMIDGRVRFYAPEGPGKHTARGGSALVYWGDRVDLFLSAFADFGWEIRG